MSEEDDEKENARAKADGKNRCDRCRRWVKEDLKTHQWKCQKCQQCGRYITFLSAHVATCPGFVPKSVLPKQKCPICPAIISRGCALRHIAAVHPKEDVEKYRQRAPKKGTKDQKAGRKVISNMIFNVLYYFMTLE